MSAGTGRGSVALLFAVVSLFAGTFTAFAYDETGYTDGSENHCLGSCHPADPWGLFRPQGPHGPFSRFTERCQVCHTIHDAVNESVKLLPSSTIVGACFTCHDGTGGQGVYGTIKARTGGDPGGGHRYSVTNVIPGGDPVTGGDAARLFRESDTGNLICTDCHTQHGADMVEPFWGERARTVNLSAYRSARQLRRQPTGATEPVDHYGSDWCLACHAGRDADGMVQNHPVDSKATSGENAPFHYNEVPILSYTGLWPPPIVLEPTRETKLGPMAEYIESSWLVGYNVQLNLGHLMPYPRSPLQEGRGPICQQCHEDTRNAGSLTADGEAMPQIGELWEENIDGLPDDPGVSPVNPRFQNFPHETENARMLVEPKDDLCLNCHLPSALP